MSKLSKTTSRKDILNQRLSIDVAFLFSKGIKVPEWKNWTEDDLSKFVPFETFHALHSRTEWLAKQFDMPATTPEGCDILDVRWMPTYHLEKSKDKIFAYMKYGKDYCSKWNLSLVAIDSEKHRLMIWDTTEQIWVEFKIKDKTLKKFLRMWIDW